MLAFHICMPLTAQNICTGTLTGTVVDEQGQGIAGAAVWIRSREEGQAADYTGRFRFEHLCPGNYEVRVQFLGYQDAVVQVRIDGTVDKVIQLKEAVTQLDEVVIRHHDAAHTENATNFKSLNEQQLAETAGKTLGEALKDITGVNSIQTGPGIFKPVIHGLHSQRILILNHGIRQEGQQWGAEHAPEIDPFIASNVVVVKDASAIKYGTEALGGTIIVNPAELPEEAGIGGSVNSVFQSNGRSGAISAMLEGGLEKHKGWGWRIQGTGKRTGDYRAPHYNLTNTGIGELNFSAATGYHSENAGFDVFFSHFKTEIGILKGTSISTLDDLVAAMERSEPEYTSGFSYKISEPRQEVSHNLFKLNGHMKTVGGEWRLQYGFQNNNRKEFDMRIGDLSRIPSIDLQLNTHTLDAEWETPHTRPVVYTLGFNSMVQENSNVPGTQRIPFIPNFSNLNGGIFAVTKISLEKTTLDFGIRYDYRHYNVKGYDFKNTFYKTAFDFNNVSASGGASFTLPNKQSLLINLSSAWRPPHVAELYSLGTHQSAASIEYGLLLNDSTNEVMDINSVNFKTEKALKLVITYQRQWSALLVELTPYINYIFNYTYLRPVGITRNVRGVYPYFRYTQTDALFVGADLSASWSISRYIKTIATASLLRASDETNNDYLVFIPPNRYDLTIRYDRPVLDKFKNFYLESRLKYVSRQSRAPRVVTVREIKEAQEQNRNIFADDPSNFDFMAAPDGYFLWNVAVGLSLKMKTVQYDIRLASDNTLNQTYREYTNRFRYYADDPGRNIILSLKCIF